MLCTICPLGGKELFHSDFLAWFAQSYPEEAAHVFSGYARPGDPGRGQDPGGILKGQMTAITARIGYLVRLI